MRIKIIIRISNLFLFFLWPQWLLSYHLFCYLSQNKSNKTYLGPVMPRGGRKWQRLIYPNHLLKPGVNLIKKIWRKFTYSFLRARSFHNNVTKLAYVYIMI